MKIKLFVDWKYKKIFTEEEILEQANKDVKEEMKELSDLDLVDLIQSATDYSIREVIFSITDLEREEIYQEMERILFDEIVLNDENYYDIVEKEI